MLILCALCAISLLPFVHGILSFSFVFFFFFAFVAAAASLECWMVLRRASRGCSICLASIKVNLLPSLTKTFPILHQRPEA